MGLLSDSGLERTPRLANKVQKSREKDFENLLPLLPETLGNSVKRGTGTSFLYQRKLTYVVTRASRRRREEWRVRVRWKTRCVGHTSFVTANLELDSEPDRL